MYLCTLTHAVTGRHRSREHYKTFNVRGQGTQLKQMYHIFDIGCRCRRLSGGWRWWGDDTQRLSPVLGAALEESHHTTPVLRDEERAAAAGIGHGDFIHSGLAATLQKISRVLFLCSQNHTQQTEETNQQQLEIHNSCFECSVFSVVFKQVDTSISEVTSSIVFPMMWPLYIFDSGVIFNL